MICKILVLLFKALTTNDKNSLLNRDNLTQPIQMQLPKKQKKKCQFFRDSRNRDQILNILKKR